MWTFPTEGETHWPPAPRYPLLSAGRWIWQQILLDIDMWEDGTDHVLHPWCLHVWWDHRRGPAKEMADPPCPIAWHSEGYVHKGWTLLAWTVPAHIHLICKTRRISLEKNCIKSFATERDRKEIYKLFSMCMQNQTNLKPELKWFTL